MAIPEPIPQFKKYVELQVPTTRAHELFKWGLHNVMVLSFMSVV